MDTSGTNQKLQILLGSLHGQRTGREAIVGLMVYRVILGLVRHDRACDASGLESKVFLDFANSVSLFSGREGEHSPRRVLLGSYDRG